MTVLLFKKRWKKFPVFTAYVLFNLVEAAVLLSVSTNGMVYFYTYWICEAITTMLGLGVVFEIFTALFSEHRALRKLALTVFRLAVIILVFLGLLVIFAQAQMEKTSVGSAGMVVAEAARSVELGLLVFLFLFSSAFGLHWRTHVFGVALGLGIFVAVDLTNLTLRSEFGRGVADVLNLARTFGFDLSLVLWAAYLFAPQRVGVTSEVPKRAQLEQWNQAVMELISQ